MDQTAKIESAFNAYVASLADKYQFKDPKRSHWIHYVSDTNRNEALILKFLNHHKEEKLIGRQVLDIGCGFGNLLVKLQTHGAQVYGIDPEPDRIFWAQKKVPNAKLILGNALQLPFEDESIDTIFCTDVFEHIEHKDQERAVLELVRVLKKKGKALIQVPNRFQFIDEHHHLPLATWFPQSVRKSYVRRFSSSSFVPCWERSRKEWLKLSQVSGVQVTLQEEYPLKLLKWFFIPASRFILYLEKRG